MQEKKTTSLCKSQNLNKKKIMKNSSNSIITINASLKARENILLCKKYIKRFTHKRRMNEGVLNSMHNLQQTTLKANNWRIKEIQADFFSVPSIVLIFFLMLVE